MEARWISVNDRLPSDDGYYAVIVEGARTDLYTTRFVSEESLNWICEHISSRKLTVNYWLEGLPLHPDTGKRFL